MTNVLITTSALHIGGAERVIANLARYVDPRKFDITVCHLKQRGEIGDELMRDGFRVVGVPPAGNLIGRYLSFLRLRRIVIENNIALIHSHTTYSLVDSALVRLTLPGVRLIHTFHYGNYPHYVRRYMQMERVFSRMANTLVAVGQEQCRTIREAYGIRPERFVTILNGVEWPGAEPDPAWQEQLAARGAVVIGTICTFIEQKGLDYLLETARRMIEQGENVVFVVVGDGPLRAGLEQKRAAMGLDDRVLFAGWKLNAARSMLPQFDIFFQPSLWEAMSMVVLEAMAAGLPLVVTDVGENRHVVVNEVTGHLVPPRDTDAMVHALRSLCRSEIVRRQMGDAGRRRYEDHYTARAMAARYEQLYSDILG